MGLFFFDGVVLGRVVAEWPLEFFLGWRLGSAFSWRCLRVGLPMAGREVVVRRSRRWGEGLAVGVNGEEGVEWWMREDGEEGGMKEVAVEKIQKAVRREWVGGKSGLLMIDKDWDLYFQGMVDAHWLLDRGKLGFGELEEGPVVAVWSGERGWLVWRPWDGDGEGDGEGKEGEGGRKLRLFKDMLTSVGKEGLFFRWVEMMQFESSRGQGGFTRERRQKVVERSRELFEEQGVSWDEAMQGIGGVDGLPGMEITG
ncbi:MAG: hypothetical protein LQ343_006869 [Gyalolechia ehrenbergii]|nr:MAG: hypothetical protein LQ343_006869 [Gyalolechia ehrenbergii]